jgi:hypothetical protein
MFSESREKSVDKSGKQEKYYKSPARVEVDMWSRGISWTGDRSK